MNGKWYSLGIADVEKILKTNAASGLTRKAARSRARKSGGNSFFFVGTKSLISCFWSVISDPMLLLLIGVDVIAAIFGEKAVALSAGVLILINIAVTFAAYIRSQRIIESMSGFSQPKLRVIRDGGLYLADSRAIVQGDVMLLSEGDILPADARLISSHELEMRVYTGKNQKTVTVFPDADARYDAETVSEFYEYKNMLYAGSVVMSGEARAVVVETGEKSYIGAFEGGMPLNDTNQRSEYLREMKRFSRIYGFIVLIMILPLTVVGILTYGSDRLLSTFMLTLSLAVSSLGELIYVIGNISTGSSLLECASKPRGAAIIRAAGRASVLAKTDRVILVGNAAVTDGIKRVSAVYVGGKELRGKQMFCRETVHLSEYAVMLDRTARAFPTLSGTFTTLPNGFAGFYKRVGVDEEALNIRTSPIGFVSGIRMTASINDGGRVVSIIAARDESVVEACSSETVSGETIVLGSERKTAIKKEYRALTGEGNEVYIITTTAGGVTVFEGMLSFKAVISPKIAECVNRLRSAGIETTLVLDGESLTDTFTAIDSGIAENSAQIVYKSRYKQICRTVNDIPEDCRAILGFSAREIREYVDKLERAGHTVMVFATSAKSYPVFAGGNITVTCDRNDYASLKSTKEKPLDLTLPSGAEESPDGSQLMRFSADVLVKRATLKGNGVEGIYNAIASARALQRNLARAVAYLLCTQFARLAFVLPAMFCGRELLSPFHLLFSGLVLDMAAMFVLAHDRPNESLMQRKYKPASLKSPILNCRAPLMIVGCAALSGAVAAILISFIGNAAVSGAVFVSLILTQLMLLFNFRHEKNVKDTMTFPFVLIAVLCAIAAVLFSVVPSLAVLTGTHFSPISLICLPIAPAVTALWYPVAELSKKLIKRKG